jgi:hypothetical protein
MALTGGLTISSTDIYSNDATQMHPLGAVGMDKYGDCYRYSKMPGDKSAGYLLVGKAREANHQNIAMSAAVAVGATTVAPTVGATAVDANEYDDGYFNFTDVSPEGEWYRIVSHDASAGSAACNFYLERPLLTAATTSSEVALVHNAWNEPTLSQLIAEPASGVSVVDIDQSEKPFTWLKTRGVAPVLVDTAGVTVGFKCAISDQVNGAVGLYSDVDAEMVVGQAMQTGTATEFNPVNLCID